MTRATRPTSEAGAGSADGASPVLGDGSTGPIPDLTFARRAGVARRAVRGTRDYTGAFAALVVIVAVLWGTQSGFMTEGNIQNMLQTNGPLFLVSIGMTFVVISAGFDLSVGSMMAMSEELILVFIRDGHLSAPLAAVLAVICCGLIGAMTNGVAIGVFKLNFFVTTLGTMILLQGVVLVASNGATQPIPSHWLTALGNNNVGGTPIPIPILICAGVLVLAWFLLRLTTFGRAVYCVGGNSEAARMSGISVQWNLIAVYGLSGVCGGIAGVIDAGRLSSATPTAGSTIALTSAAAVLLGGASLMGGVGKLTGTVIGVLVLATLGNGVDLFGLSAYWQDVVTGAVLLIAILFDQANKSGLLARGARRGSALGGTLGGARGPAPIAEAGLPADP